MAGHKVEVKFHNGAVATVWEGKSGHGCPSDKEILSKLTLDPARIARVYVIDEYGSERRIWSFNWVRPKDRLNSHNPVFA